MKAEKLIKAVQDNAWDVVAFSTCQEAYGWLVIGHYMEYPQKRVLGVSYREDGWCDAVGNAIETTKESVYDYLYDFDMIHGGSK